MRKEESFIERYRERAAQLRIQAKDESEETQHALLLKCAQDYDDLAVATRALDRANRPFTD